MNILAVGYPEWYGVKRVLQCLTPDMVPVAEAVDHIERCRPRVVVFGCWTPDMHPALTRCQQLNITTVVTWYAGSILHEFDAVNRTWLLEALSLLQRGAIDFFATTHIGLQRTLSHYGVRCDLLEPFLDLEALSAVPPASPSDDERIHIGIFGSGQPWKNMEAQILAASMVPNAVVHVQTLPRKSLVQFLGCRVEVHPGVLPDVAYYQLLQRMHVNLCVSYAETYSYLCMESLALGVPVLTTGQVPFVRVHLPQCVTQDGDDPAFLAVHIDMMLSASLTLRDDLTALRGRFVQWNTDSRDYMERLTTRWLAHQ
jgi:glycosyltransferase involved in cell wall biosynthesis